MFLTNVNVRVVTSYGRWIEVNVFYAYELFDGDACAIYVRACVVHAFEYDNALTHVILACDGFTNEFCVGFFVFFFK